MCLIWNLIKAFTDAEDDNKKDNNNLEDWQKELIQNQGHQLTANLLPTLIVFIK